jgi:hypothetical protein
MAILDLKTQQKIAEFLPRALDIAITAYQDTYTTPMSEEEKADPQKVAARYAICKILLSHMILLFKVAHEMIKRGVMKKEDEDKVRHNVTYQLGREDVRDMTHPINSGPSS